MLQVQIQFYPKLEEEILAFGDPAGWVVLLQKIDLLLVEPIIPLGPHDQN